MAKISIVVPIYNEEENIHTCVDSVMGQTFTDWELILVDDGSKDGSSAICDACAAADSRVRVIHQANRGFSGARNTGVDAARGDYLMFVDADDWLEPKALEVGVGDMERYGADLVIGGFNWVVFQGDKLISSDKTAPSEDMLFRVKDMAQAGPAMWDVSHYGGCLHYCVWGRIYRMRIINDFHLRLNEGLCVQEDVEFMYNYFHYSDKCVVSKEVFYNYYRPHDKDDIGEKPQIDQYLCAEASLVAFLKSAVKFDYPEEYRQQMYYRTFEHFIKLSGKIFLSDTGLTEEERYHHIRCLTETFAFRFFCQAMSATVPFWLDMKQRLEAGDYAGLYRRWKETLFEGVSTPGK